MDLVPRDNESALIADHIGTPAAYGRPYATTPPVAEEANIIARLRRQKLAFASVFCTVLTVVAGAYFVLPPVYKAEALVTVAATDPVLASLQPSDSQQLTIGDTADLESQSIVLSSPMLLRDVLSQGPVEAALLLECQANTPPLWKQTLKELLGRTTDPSCQERLADRAKSVENLQSRVVVGVSGRSRVLSVSFSSTLPTVAQTVANAIVQTYLMSRTEEKLQPRTDAIAWLTIETQRVADRLKQTETQIGSFLHANGVIKGQLAPIASEQLTGLAQQIAIAEAERAAAAGRMQQALFSGASTTGVLEDKTVNDEKQQLSAVNAQIAQLSSRYGSAYPPLVDLQQQRRALERAVNQDTGVVTHSAIGDYQAANSRVAALQAQISNLKKEVRGNDDATTQVAALERSLATDRELYLDLTKSLNQLQTNRRLVTPNARLVSLAEEPQSVSFPKPSSFALAGLLLAFGLASVAALIRDRADRTVRTVDGLQAAAHLRVLSRVPYVPGLGRSGSRMTKRIATPSSFQEAIRKLYAECLLVAERTNEADRRRRSILVASSDRGEGKTFITLALAHFAAAAGRRVIVLECDLRQPSAARSLSLPEQWGMSEILRGQVSAEEAVTSSQCPGVDIILSGKPAMNSAELLGSARMMALLAWASSRYDLVLIDTPPSQMLPDARILAPAVDGILFCTRWGKSDMAGVQRGIRELQAVGGRLYGLVLDGIQPARYRLYDREALEAGSYLALR